MRRRYPAPVQQCTGATRRYKDHQTETCDEERPHLIVHVVTTLAPEQDIGVVEGIHAGLAGKELTPAEHLLDSGYVTPETVHHAATQHAITIVGPVRQDPRAGERPGYAKEDFHVDWQAETVTCPQGTVSPPWKPTVADRKPRLPVLFRRADCRACTVRQDCTGNVDGKGRHLLLLPQPLQEVQTRARAQQQTPEWKRRYALRTGAEATVSETVHAHGLRHCRYRGTRQDPRPTRPHRSRHQHRPTQPTPTRSSSTAAKPSTATPPRTACRPTLKITNSIRFVISPLGAGHGAARTRLLGPVLGGRRSL